MATTDKEDEMNRELPASWREHPFDPAAAFGDTGPGYLDDDPFVKVVDPLLTDREAEAWKSQRPEPEPPPAPAYLDTPEADERRVLQRAIDEGLIALRHLDLFLRWLNRYETGAKNEYLHLHDELTQAVDRYEVRLDRDSRTL